MGGMAGSAWLLWAWATVSAAEQAVVIVLGVQRRGCERQQQRGSRQDEGEAQMHLLIGTCAGKGR